MLRDARPIAPLADETGFVPRAERVSFDMAVRCRRDGWRGSLVLRNLTVGGARIEGLDDLRPGDALTLNLPTLAPKRATVVWVDGEGAGCEFERPLHPDVFETLVLHHAQWRQRGEADRADRGLREITGPAMPRPPAGLTLFSRPRLAYRNVPAAA